MIYQKKIHKEHLKIYQKKKTKVFKTKIIKKQSNYLFQNKIYKCKKLILVKDHKIILTKNKDS